MQIVLYYDSLTAEISPLSLFFPSFSFLRFSSFLFHIYEMPLIGIPDSITPELLYGLAKMGHGDTLVIADANFPSDSVAKGDGNSSTCILNK